MTVIDFENLQAKTITDLRKEVANLKRQCASLELEVTRLAVSKAVILGVIEQYVQKAEGKKI